MSKSSKLPALQFYPGDWRKDIGVQSLTYHDRAVWFEILLLMHESERRGMLLLGGNAMTTDILSRLLNLSKEELDATIHTLVTHGVTELDSRTGALINRRMLRDEITRSETRGRMRNWRNHKKIKGSCNDLVTPSVTPMLPLSSSSSSSSSSIQKISTIARFTSDEINSIYQAYPRKIAKQAALKAIEKALKRLEGPGEVAYLLAVTREYAQSPAGNNGEYTPYPATWFNRSSYLDDPKEWEKVGR